MSRLKAVKQITWTHAIKLCGIVGMREYFGWKVSNYCISLHAKLWPLWKSCHSMNA